MTDEVFKTIDGLMESGNTKEAEAQLRRILEETPEDWDALMMLGTCCALNGDLETAREIHEKCEAHFKGKEPGQVPAAQYSFWQKYNKWIIAGGIVALIGMGTLNGCMQSVQCKYAAYDDSLHIRNVRRNIRFDNGENIIRRPVGFEDDER